MGGCGGKPSRFSRLGMLWWSSSSGNSCALLRNLDGWLWRQTEQVQQVGHVVLVVQMDLLLLLVASVLQRLQLLPQRRHLLLEIYWSACCSIQSASCTSRCSAT